MSAYTVTEEQREAFKHEIETYRAELKDGGYPELPIDISLIAELAEIEYDPAKYEQKAGAYSNRDIKEALLDGHIRIFPFIEENLKGTSYDVTLGDWFYVMDRVHNRQNYNPRSEADVKRYFDGPHQATTNAEWCAKQFGDSFEFSEDQQLYLRNIPPEALVVALGSHERILAHTHEYIGIRAPGTTQMQARSSFGRNGIVVCKDAGWGDPGYVNRWTMEIQNDNNERVPLVVGDRPAQIVFYASGKVEGAYGDSGKYYRTSSLLNDIAAWRPHDMLPKNYRDEYMEPISLDAGLKFRLERGGDE